MGKNNSKGAVTSLDNIISNWDNINKKGLKTLVNKALARLEIIKGNSRWFVHVNHRF